MRIAVIDSGVHRNHPHIVTIAGGASFGPESPDYADQLGHGTAVMAAIQEKAPLAEYYALKVFHKSLNTRIESIIEALKWCQIHKIDLVNLSLGASNPAHSAKFEPFTQTLNLIAAAGTLPGTLPGVIAVEVAPNCPRDKYLYNKETGIFAASPHPRPIPGVPPQHNLQGISFAVANLTGFAAQYCNPQTPGSLRASLIKSLE